MKRISTEELLAELQYRKDHPEYFIRELVEYGYNLDNDAFRDATNWMDDQSFYRVQD